jgi:hypothetical protein
MKQLTTELTVFDVEPFGHELKAEWLRRSEDSLCSQKAFSRSFR